MVWSLSAKFYTECTLKLFVKKIKIVGITNCTLWKHGFRNKMHVIMTLTYSIAIMISKMTVAQTKTLERCKLNSRWNTILSINALGSRDNVFKNASQYNYCVNFCRLLEFLQWSSFYIHVTTIQHVIKGSGVQIKRKYQVASCYIEKALGTLTGHLHSLQSLTHCMHC